VPAQFLEKTKDISSNAIATREDDCEEHKREVESQGIKRRRTSLQGIPCSSQKRFRTSSGNHEQGISISMSTKAQALSRKSNQFSNDNHNNQEEVNTQEKSTNATTDKLMISCSRGTQQKRTSEHKKIDDAALVLTNNNSSPKKEKTFGLFEKRLQDLVAFKSKFGHCAVPRTYPENPSLGQWCKRMRGAYNAIQKGKKTSYNVSPERIKQLEEIGFKWKLVDNDKTFEKRIQDLIAFKSKFGHCDVRRTYSGDPSLGRWCKNMREAYKAYNAIQKGKKTSYNVSPERIKQLEAIGFKWKMRRADNDETFEKRFRDLVAFKEKYGHCNVTLRYHGDPSLGQWGADIRVAYKSSKLSSDRIKRLEEIGFK